MRVVIAAILIVAAAGCTTMAAPEPGERAQLMFCERGTLKVCTGFVGSRIKDENPSCSCS
jgi:hypothetical protein